MGVRILTTSPLIGPHIANLGEEFPELCIASYRSVEWTKALSGAEALIVLLSEPLTEDDLKSCVNLKVIGTYSVGINHLPQAFCKARGIPIISTPGVLTDATADLALALLMTLVRQVIKGDELMRSGQWKGWAPDLLLGSGLSGKTCGILGSGPIGRAFAKRVWAAGMKVIFWDRDGEGSPVDFGADIAERFPLDELLRRSNVLSLHCPLTDRTRGLITRDRLLFLPDGAIVINTARGGIIDEEAVMDLVEQEKIGGVGFDVFDNEPNINPRWRRTPRTVLLPHLGSATTETREKMCIMICDGIRRILNMSS